MTLKNSLKISGLCTCISDVLPELNILCSKLFYAVKIQFIIFIILKEGDLVFRAVYFLCQGTVVVDKFVKEGILYSDNELSHNGKPVGTVFSGLITSLRVTRTLKV